MRVGVLELLTGEVQSNWLDRTYAFFVTKQYASLMPQAISVWCRELGHEVFYATYWGQADPKRLLPDDLDIVFIAAYAQAANLAYALAKLYRAERTVTVLGGPHAKAFPADSLRFFDVVVRECDKTLLREIMSDPPVGQIVTSGRLLQDIPSVAERMPEIQRSVFWRGRPYVSTTISLLTSVGCPYTCNFCTDWDNPYALLPLDRLAADLQFISQQLPGVMIGFTDPNFGVKFEPVLGVLESIPAAKRNRYIIETSLTLLRRERLERLRDTGCYYIAPGVESWASYSNKAGVGRTTTGKDKLEQVIGQFEVMQEYVPGIQANFIFGLDVDQGDEPVEFTKEFMMRAPYIWPTVNIPTPFGGTPFYDQYLTEGRILMNLPFSFYYTPYLATTIKNYSPVEYYQKLHTLYDLMLSPGMLAQRLKTTRGLIRASAVARTAGNQSWRAGLRRILELLKTDRQFRAYHEGETQRLPQFYRQEFDRLLGRYAGLLSDEERTPLHQPSTPLSRFPISVP